MRAARPFFCFEESESDGLGCFESVCDRQFFGGIASFPDMILGTPSCKNAEKNISNYEKN